MLAVFAPLVGAGVAPVPGDALPDRRAVRCARRAGLPRRRPPGRAGGDVGGPAPASCTGRRRREQDPMTGVAVIAHQNKQLGGGLGELRQTLADAGVTAPLWFEVPKSKKAPEAGPAGRGRRAPTSCSSGAATAWCSAASTRSPAPASTVAILPAGTANLLADQPRRPEGPRRGRPDRPARPAASARRRRGQRRAVRGDGRRRLRRADDPRRRRRAEGPGRPPRLRRGPGGATCACEPDRDARRRRRAPVVRGRRDVRAGRQRRHGDRRRHRLRRRPARRRMARGRRGHGRGTGPVGAGLRPHGPEPLGPVAVRPDDAGHEGRHPPRPEDALRARRRRPQARPSG